MKSLLRWKPELRDDGVWLPAIGHWLYGAVLLALVAIAIDRYPSSSSWGVALFLAVSCTVAWLRDMFRWGWGDRLLFGITWSRSDPEPVLVAKKQRFPVSAIERVVVHGPLDRRLVTVHPKEGMPFELVSGWPREHRGMAERHLLANPNELSVKIEIHEPESPLFQPNPSH
jgi:hypothetical protein